MLQVCGLQVRRVQVLQLQVLQVLKREGAARPPLSLCDKEMTVQRRNSSL